MKRVEMRLMMYYVYRYWVDCLKAVCILINLLMIYNTICTDKIY